MEGCRVFVFVKKSCQLKLTILSTGRYLDQVLNLVRLKPVIMSNTFNPVNCYRSFDLDPNFRTR